MKRRMKQILAAAMAVSMLTGTGLTAAAEEERMTISVIGIDWGYGPLPDSEMEQAWEDLFDVNLEMSG